MDAIKVLRQRAADKRDKAVKAARDDFRKASRLLDALQESIGSEPLRQRRRNLPRPILELIEKLMPRDKPFTLDDIMERLQQAEPGREFNRPSVRLMLPKLAERGTVRKVRRSANGYAYWAAAECEADDSPIAAMSITDAAMLVLGERGPLTAAEIVVALKERGYRVDADPRTLLRTLQYAFKRNRGRFVRGDGGRWVMA